MSQYLDKALYGLLPKDFTIEQIQKMPSPVLWKHIKSDVRFEDEFLSRVKSLSLLQYEIGCNFDALYFHRESPRLITIVNQLAPQETSCDTLEKYDAILNKDSQHHYIKTFISSGRYKVGFPKWLQVIQNKYHYLDGDDVVLVDLIFEFIKNNYSREITLDLIGHLSQDKLKETYNKIKECAPNAILGSLLCHVEGLPETEHLFLLRAMSRLTSFGYYQNRYFKTKVDPLLIKRLTPLGRVQVLEHMSQFKEYPFTKRILISDVDSLLFPAMFKKGKKITEIINKWKELDKKVDPNLTGCVINSSTV